MSDLIERLQDCDNNSVQRESGSRIFGEAAAEIERLTAEVLRQTTHKIYRQETIAKLLARNELLEAGLKSVADLVGESGGVYGLHLNGDLCPWGDLLEGGRFEEWLINFSLAAAQHGDSKPQCPHCAGDRSQPHKHCILR